MRRLMKECCFLEAIIIIWTCHVFAQKTPTWGEVKIPQGLKYSIVDFADSLKGCLFTQQGAYVNTSDGGKSWSSPETLQNCTKIVKVKHLTSETIIAVDEMDSRLPLPIDLYISTDSGMNWYEKMLPDSVVMLGGPTVSLLNETCIGFVNPGAVLYRSTDLGASWDTLQLYPLSFITALHLFQRNNFIFCGGNGLIGSGEVSQSTDSGKTWTRLYSGTSITSEYYSRSLGFFEIWHDDGNITTTNTVLYNPTKNSKVSFMNGGGPGALYDDGTYILAEAWVTQNQRTVQFTTTDNRHAWILTDSSRLYQRTDLLTGVAKMVSSGSPLEFSLDQNFPNPFNPSTVISYQLTVNTFVTLKVYDLLGREITELLHDRQDAGTHEVRFNGVNLPSGVYYYMLETNGARSTRKMVLLR